MTERDHPAPRFIHDVVVIAETRWVSEADFMEDEALEFIGG